MSTHQHSDASSPYSTRPVSRTGHPSHPTVGIDTSNSDPTIIEIGEIIPVPSPSDTMPLTFPHAHASLLGAGSPSALSPVHIGSGGLIGSTAAVALAFVQFMNADQAMLAMRHLNGLRLLGPDSTPIRITISTMHHIQNQNENQNTPTIHSPRTRGGNTHSHTNAHSQTQHNGSGVSSVTVSPPSISRVMSAPTAAAAAAAAASFSSSLNNTTTRDYTSHAGHRFKYLRCKNSTHVCAPCAALHVSGLTPDTNEVQLRFHFESLLSRALGTSTSRIVNVSLFGGERKMAFITCTSVDIAIMCIIFGHNQRMELLNHHSGSGGAGGTNMRGPYLRLTFSHAKEHTNHHHQQQHGHASHHQQGHALHAHHSFPHAHAHHSHLQQGGQYHPSYDHSSSSSTSSRNVSHPPSPTAFHSIANSDANQYYGAVHHQQQQQLQQYQHHH
jgi:hypothetical protein